LASSRRAQLLKVLEETQVAETAKRQLSPAGEIQNRKNLSFQLPGTVQNHDLDGFGKGSIGLINRHFHVAHPVLPWSVVDVVDLKPERNSFVGARVIPCRFPPS